MTPLRKILAKMVLLCVVGGLLLASAAGASADIIRLVNGEELRGRVIAETRRSITIEVPNGRMTLPRHQIVEVIHEDDGEYLLKSAAAHLRAGRDGVAEPLLREAHEHGVEAGRVLLAEVLLRRCDREKSRGDLSAARACIDEAAALAANVEAVQAKALRKRLRRVGQDAELHSEDLIVRRERAQRLLKNGREAMGRGDFEAAIERLRAAKAKDMAVRAAADDGLAVATARLGLARAQSGRFAEAAALFDQSVSLRPELLPQLRTALVVCRVHVAGRLALAGLEDRARDTLLSATAIDPEAAMAHFYLAALFEARGEVRKAAGHYRVALKGSGRRVTGGALVDLRRAAADHLGDLPIPVETLWQAGRLDEARRVLDREAAYGRIVVRAPTAAAARAVLAAALSARTRVAAWAGSGVNEVAVDIYVFARLDTLHRASAQNFHALGITRTRRDLDGTPRYEVYTALDASGVLDSVVPHEMFHALAGSNPDTPIPLWLNEGLAVSSEPASESLRRAKRYLGGRDRRAGLALPDILSLQGYPEGEDGLLSFYDGAAALTLFLIDRSDREAVLRAGREAATPEAFLARFGLPSAEVAELQLLEWLRSR